MISLFTTLRDIPFVRRFLNHRNRWKPLISDELVSQIQGAGFHLFDPEIPETVIDQVRADMDSRMVELDYHLPSSRWLNGWKQSTAIKSIALAPKVLRLLRQLYNREPIPFQTMNHRIGTELRLHTDSIHFATDPPGFMCGVWVALQDMDERNGTLVYYPYSHKLPTIKTEDFSPTTGVKYYTAYEDLVQNVIEKSGLKPEMAIVPKGMAILWVSNLVHGGIPIVDQSSTRYSQVTHYTFKNCQYYFPLESYGGHRHLMKPETIC